MSLNFTSGVFWHIVSDIIRYFAQPTSQCESDMIIFFDRGHPVV